MSHDPISAKDAAQLMARLARRPEVNGLDSEDEGSEAEALASALVDIAESFQVALEEHFPRIANSEATGDELIDAVDDLREELRHVLYHLHDSRSLRMLFEPGRDYTLPHGAPAVEDVRDD